MDEERNASYPVVNAHNEWDPLEQVIVGIVEGAMIPPWDVIMETTLHRKNLWDFYKKFGGTAWPRSGLRLPKRTWMNLSTSSRQKV